MVANGLSKMLSLGKFTPSLGISALKNSVSESRISGNMTVSESRILKIWISKSRQWDFLSAMVGEGALRDEPKQRLRRRLIRNEKLRNLPLPESAFTIVM